MLSRSKFHIQPKLYLPIYLVGGGPLLSFLVLVKNSIWNAMLIFTAVRRSWKTDRCNWAFFSGNYFTLSLLCDASKQKKIGTSDRSCSSRPFCLVLLMKQNFRRKTSLSQQSSNDRALLPYLPWPLPDPIVRGVFDLEESRRILEEPGVRPVTDVPVLVRLP